MSDIIKDAKKLLELVDEERADLESRGAEPNEYGGFEMWLEATVLYDNAKEVRESIKELAEETWEYAVQVWLDGEWLSMLTCNYGTILQRRGRTFPSKKEAEEFAKGWTRGTPTRIVRRRVSPIYMAELI